MAMQGKESENGVYEFPYMRRKNTQSQWEQLRLAIWDSANKKFLKRDAASWGKILFFYSVFYVVLAALFALCMQVMLMTLDDNRPKWLLDSSRIGTSPGMGFRPISNRTEEGSLIWYDAKNETSVRKWTELIDDYLKLYIDSSQLPGGGRNQVVCSFEKNPGPDQVCAVEVDKWGPCSRANGYGYNKSSPCFFLKLNRIYGWEAEYYSDVNNLPSEMPDNLKDYIRRRDQAELQQIWVSCEGDHPADKEMLPSNFDYYPTRGFPHYYYPYMNVEGYLSPLVAVQVPHPVGNILINIECRAWAKNINYNGANSKREGSVHLEIMVD